jgi:hypothetical protein
MRPNELYGMGKESLTCTSEHETLDDFLVYLSKNSSSKHENNVEFILGSEDCFEIEAWKEYIGQPRFFIVDIKVEKI